jgi:hypothetical protein
MKQKSIRKNKKKNNNQKNKIKFDIKIKWNQMMMDEIKEKKSIKKQIAIKKWESNLIQKINERTPLYFGTEKKKVYQSSITIKIIFMFIKRSNFFRTTY